VKFRKDFSSQFLRVKNAQTSTSWSLVSKLMEALKSQKDAECPEPYSDGPASV